MAELHDQVHQKVEFESCRRNYLPEIWMQHCSLAVAIDPARRSEVMAIVETEISPFEVVFDVIDCVRFHPVEVFCERTLPAVALSSC